MLVSRINGVKPTKVVMEVSKIGRRRFSPASQTAIKVSTPLLRCSLIQFINTKLSFTTMPLTATMPMNDHKVSSRSEEHTSELQSRPHLVCRLLLEKKKKKK